MGGGGWGVGGGGGGGGGVDGEMIFTPLQQKTSINITAVKQAIERRRLFSGMLRRCSAGELSLIVMQMSETEQSKNSFNALVLVFFSWRPPLLPSSLLDLQHRKTHLLQHQPNFSNL